MKGGRVASSARRTITSARQRIVAWLILCAAATLACGPIDIGDVSDTAAAGLEIVGFEDGPGPGDTDRRVFAGQRLRVVARVRNSGLSALTDLRASLVFVRDENGAPVRPPPRVTPDRPPITLVSGEAGGLPLEVEVDRATPADLWRVGLRVQGSPNVDVTLAMARWHAWTVSPPPRP